MMVSEICVLQFIGLNWIVRSKKEDLFPYAIEWQLHK